MPSARSRRTPRSAALLAALLSILPPLAARANAAASRTVTGDYAVGGAKRLELRIPFGGVRIVGTDGSQVRVRVEASCKHDDGCDEFLEGLRLERSDRGGTLRVILKAPHLDGNWDTDSGKEGWGDRRNVAASSSSNRYEGDESDLKVSVEVPRSLAVDLKVGAGQLDIGGLRRDLSINLGAGQVNVRMDARHVGSIDVNMAIGATAIHEGGRTLEYARVLGGPVSWHNGKGDAEITVQVGAGDVEVTLD